MARKQADEDDKQLSKAVVWLHGEIKSPPFSDQARREAGFLIGKLQCGESLGMPWAEPLPIVGPRCGALRVRGMQHNWRVMYRVDTAEVLILDVYDKKARKIPDQVINQCKKRLKAFDEKEKTDER